MFKVLQGADAVRHIQHRLQQAGFYDGEIDGKWGGVSEGALERLLLTVADAAIMTQIVPTSSARPGLCWGAKVSSVFRDRIRWIAEELRHPEMSSSGFADDLMACIAWETGRTFSASVVNKAGSGATGLIQFLPSTAISLGTTTAQLAKMTAEDQLNYVYKYFRPWAGKLRNLGDVYMAILWPAAVGKPDTYVLWDKESKPTTYRQNAGLDLNKNGTITRAECLVKIRELQAEGFRPGNVWTGG